MPYGSQTWTFTIVNTDEMAKTHRAMKAVMLGIQLTQKTNNCIGKTTKIYYVKEQIARLKWSFAGLTGKQKETSWNNIIQ